MFFREQTLETKESISQNFLWDGPREGEQGVHSKAICFRRSRADKISVDSLEAIGTMTYRLDSLPLRWYHCAYQQVDSDWDRRPKKRPSAFLWASVLRAFVALQDRQSVVTEERACPGSSIGSAVGMGRACEGGAPVRGQRTDSALAPRPSVAIMEVVTADRQVGDQGFCFPGLRAVAFALLARRKAPNWDVELRTGGYGKLSSYQVRDSGSVSRH
jgi:hypothetical protein